MITSSQLYTKKVAQTIFEPQLLAYSVRTASEGWQIVAWNIAKANRQFILHGYKKAHQTFVEELAFTYAFRLEMLGRKVVFVPQNQFLFEAPLVTACQICANNQTVNSGTTFSRV